MSRLLPKTSTLQLPTPERSTPGLKVFADTNGSVQDLGLAQNLAYSTGHCGPMLQQCWSDGQFATAIGSAETEYLRFKVPNISKQHTIVNCSIYASSSSGTGVFKLANGANSVNSFVTGSSYGWYDINLTASVPTEDAELVFSVQRDIDIQTLRIQRDIYDPGNSWPTDDSALDSGVKELVPSSSFVPLDEDELDPDSPLAPELGYYMADNIDNLNDRRRVYFAHVGLSGSTLQGGSKLPFNLDYPHRGIVPVNTAGTDLELHFWVTPDTSDDSFIYVKHGPDPFYSLGTAKSNVTDGVNITKITVPAGASDTWITDSVTLRDRNWVANAPGRYPGFTFLEFWQGPDEGSSNNCQIWSITAIGE